MSWTVGQVGELAGVTVRTLHHYDAIGLLRPSGRTAGGHRDYADADLARLRQVLLYRELGFSLEDIATILDDPEADTAAHLRRQHRLLRERIERLSEVVAAVEKEMEAQQMGISLTPEEQLEVFGRRMPDGYQQEAEERWGDTDAWRQSQRRTAAYTKEDWLRIKAEGDAVERRFVELQAAGAPADGPEAMDAAEAHRQQISRWFYDCGYDVHRGIASMYVDDERFRVHYEDLAPGLAEYVRDAVHGNAARAGI